MGTLWHFGLLEEEKNCLVIIEKIGSSKAPRINSALSVSTGVGHGDDTGAVSQGRQAFLGRFPAPGPKEYSMKTMLNTFDGRSSDRCFSDIKMKRSLLFLDAYEANDYYGMAM